MNAFSVNSFRKPPPVVVVSLDLNISKDDMNTIRQRLQLIFNVIIYQNNFLYRYTYSHICSFLYTIYKQGELAESTGAS
jgi:hypothetical protein